MVDLVEDLVSDTGNNHYSATAYKRFVSDAWLSVAKLVPSVVEAEYTASKPVGTGKARTDGMSTIHHVDWDDEPLEPISPLQLQQWDRDWERVGGTPRYYITEYLNHYGYIPANTVEFFEVQIWPIADAAGTIRVIGYKEPAELSDDTDSPDFPYWAHDAIVYEAAARALEARSELRNPDLAKAYRFLRDGYVEAVNNMYTNRMPNRVLSVGGPDASKQLTRETSVNATGKAGAGS